MVEVFNYTERVVNMIRPRKLLFMAIGTSNACSMRSWLNLYIYRWCCAPCQDEPAALSSFPFGYGGKGEGRCSFGVYPNVGRCVLT